MQNFSETWNETYMGLVFLICWALFVDRSNVLVSTFNFVFFPFHFPSLLQGNMWALLNLQRFFPSIFLFFPPIPLSFYLKKKKKIFFWIEEGTFSFCLWLVSSSLHRISSSRFFCVSSTSALYFYYFPKITLLKI